MLDWRIDKLAATGWRATKSLDDEIDDTYRCVEARSGGGLEVARASAEPLKKCRHLIGDQLRLARSSSHPLSALA